MTIASPPRLPAVLLFDLDGTLTDNFDGISRSILHALSLLGARAPTRDELRACVGPPLRRSFAQLLATDDPSRIESALAHYRARYAETGWRENFVCEGMANAVAALAAAGPTLHVCTSKPQPYAERIIEHFGLAPHFASVCGVDLAGTLDDKATLVAHLLARANLDPGDCAMIGDREHDVRAAHANGVRAAGVLWGYGPRAELERAGADVIVETPRALPDALSSLANRK
ncbi:MAG: HAD hydrolase-like protein [Casimicrobiaceae bacterium]